MIYRAFITEPLWRDIRVQKGYCAAIYRAFITEQSAVTRYQGSESTQHTCTSLPPHGHVMATKKSLTSYYGRFTHSMPCRQGFKMCLSHLIYTVRPCLIHTCHPLPMSCPCHALTMPFFSRPRHSTAVERRPVGYLPTFGFFRLPRGVPRRLLSEAYQPSSQPSIPTIVKSGSSTLQKRRSVKLLD